MKKIKISKLLKWRALPIFSVLIIVSAFLFTHFVVATTWTDQTASGTRNWADIACNTDCTKIIAADSFDTSSKLYRSTDSGVTWTAITNGGAAFQKQWKRVASSADGTKLIASELSGDVYYSTDSGANWTSAGLGTASWTGLCMSDDGATMEAIANGTQVGYWYSTNSGSSWTNTSGLDSLTPNTIACSSDGTKVVVGMFGNNMYYSSNSGSSWSALSASQSGFWNGVAMSADGTKIAGVLSFGGDLWTSTDSGASWTDRSGAGTGGGGLWQSVAMSTNGATIIGVSTVNVKSSTDSGGTWATESGPGTATWKDVWVSDDGSYWVIGGTTTDIWTQGSPPASPPTLTASAPSSVTTTTATFNGNITSTGNVNPTTRGFHYGTTTGYGTTSSTSGSYSTGAYTASITGLVCNTTYHYEAFATNTAGTGASSDVSFTTSACPVAPTVTTTASPTSITASSAVASGNITATGGENPASRYIEYGLTTSYGSQSPADSGSFSTGTFSETVIGLSAGTTYHYRACASNTAGAGCGADQTFTTLAAPGAPTGLSGTAGYTQVSLSWTAPGSIGGYAISDYLIEYKTTAGSTWFVYPHTASTTTSAIIPNLTNGTSYDFRVSAVNFAGAGTASSTIARTPSSTPTAPNAPTGLTGTTGSTQVALSWTAPTNNGGASITDYTIEYKTIAAGSWSTFSHSASTATSRTVTGLTNGTMYQFRVSAVNSVGTGTASSTLNKPAATTTYYHVLSTGQSLAEGVNSTTALSTTQPYNNKSLSTGPIAGSSAPLIPLVEGVVARESPISGMLNSLRAADVTNGFAIIGGTHSGGGQSYDSIKKGGTGGYYALGQTQASTAKTETESAGAFYQPYAATIVHGETDAINGTPGATYTADMGQMQIDYQTDWNTLTGLSNTIPLFESQMNTNSVGTIAAAQLDAHRNYPGKVILVGPKYQLPYSGDGLHLSNIGSRLLGEYFGKVMKKVLIDGTTWDPLMPKSVTRSGTTVTVSYKIPSGTLAVDTTNVAARTNKGFEFVQTGGSAISITGVSLTDSNTRVAITLSGVPDGTNPRIRYAWSCEAHPNDNAYATCGDPTNNSLIGGNIRDTDTTTSPSSNGSGTALYDWSVAFDEPITSPSAPDAPTALAATRGNSQVALSWTAPVVDGGSSVTDYRVEYKTVAASTWSVFADGTSTATSATVTGLSNGTQYEFRVSAINANGTGTASGTVESTPATTPGTPTGLGGTGGALQVALTWSAPASDGGAYVYDYGIEYKRTVDSSWTTFSHTLSNATSATITGLLAATSYDFRVSATNGVGTGSVSSTATVSTNAASVPGAPTGLGATPGNTQAALSWTAPASDGGASITDYLVEYKLTSSGSWSTFTDGVSTSTSATVTGLTNGSSYDFRVSAINSAGTGAASGTATTTPVGAPGAPTGLGTTPGNTQVVLSWTAPVSNGGSAITDYLVEYNSGSGYSTFADGVSTSTSATVTGLANGTSYTFRVSAINAIGTGTASGTASATPRTTPGAPTSLAATPASGQSVLTWTAPVSNGGSAITDYLVEYKLSSDSVWSTFIDGVTATTGATVTGLTDGSSYDFRVSAINAAGTGSASSTATSVYVIVPGSPTSLLATVGNMLASLTWVAPVSNGGASITDYLVEYKLSSAGSWSTFLDGTSTALSASVTGLTNGSSYDFRVSATNSAGTGSPSSTTTATPVAPVVSGGGGNFGHPEVAMPQVSPTYGGGSRGGTYVSPVDTIVRACPAAVGNIKLGDKGNDTAQVKLWQAFLNGQLNLKIPLTGFYGPMTFAATKQFQLVHKNEILTPNGLKNPTGYIATSTRSAANRILGCN